MLQRFRLSDRFLRFGELPRTERAILDRLESDLHCWDDAFRFERHHGTAQHPPRRPRAGRQRAEARLGPCPHFEAFPGRDIAHAGTKNWT
jgi:hypothetical protein